MKISPLNSFNKYIGKNLNKAASWGWMRNACEKGLAHPVKAGAAMMVLSIVSKDIVGCILYTTQSWNNKKIPEQKRKFLAMTDLMNGIIMIGGQLFAGKIIEKRFGPWLTGKYFTGRNTIQNKENGTIEYKPIHETKAPFAPDNVYQNYLTLVKNNKEKLKKLGMKVDDEKILGEIGNEIVNKYGVKGEKGKAIEAGFAIIVTSLGTMALVKRTIAPLLSTPLAGYVKHKYIDKDKKGQNTEKKSNNPDDELLSHTMAPWNQNTIDDSFKKVMSK